MSTKVIAAMASILVIVLPMIGVEFSSEKLTVFTQDLVVILSAAWVWFRTVSKEKLTIVGTSRKTV